MITNFDKYKTDLANLLRLGQHMLSDILLNHKNQFDQLTKTEKAEFSKNEGVFAAGYQQWYSTSLAVIGQLLPERKNEFIKLYEKDNKRKNLDSHSFTIQDWLLGARARTDILDGTREFQDLEVVINCFKIQMAILESAEQRFKSSLFDIRQILQAELFDSELESARELLKNGWTRAAGAIAGVVLEGHLSETLGRHEITILKKEPHIGDYNDTLKKEEVIDVSNWRFIQRLGDLRNLCDHKKEREPTGNEVNELIDGVDKVIKTLF